MAKIIYRDERGEIIERLLESDYGDVNIAFENGNMKVDEGRNETYDLVIPIENLIEMYC